MAIHVENPEYSAPIKVRQILASVFSSLKYSQVVGISECLPYKSGCIVKYIAKHKVFNEFKIKQDIDACLQTVKELKLRYIRVLDTSYTIEYCFVFLP